jgi:hypothetical protein
MKLIEIAVIMLVFNLSLAVVNEMDIFGIGTEIHPEYATRAEMQAKLPSAEALQEETGVFGFIQRGLNAMFSLLNLMRNIVFMGSQINDIMKTAFGLSIPSTLVTLLNATCSFIYSIAVIQLLMKFKVE